MQDFRQLKVWGKAHALILDVYRTTVSFPRHETYGLVSQLRRAAASIGANLAAGCGRSSRADFARFAQMALGSASEVEYELLLAHDLDYLKEPDYRNMAARIIEVKRMLTALIQTLHGEGHPDR